MTYSWIRSIWQLNSIRDERWNYSTCKPSKLLTVRGCRKHDIMTCRSIQRFCGAHHTPGLGALRTNAIACHIDVSDALVDFKCLGQGLEAAAWRQRQIKVGVSFVGPSDKTWLLKCSKKGHSTETCRISLIQNLEKQSRNPEFDSASTYLLTT